MVATILTYMHDLELGIRIKITGAQAPVYTKSGGISISECANTANKWLRKLISRNHHQMKNLK